MYVEPSNIEVDETAMAQEVRREKDDAEAGTSLKAEGVVEWISRNQAFG